LRDARRGGEKVRRNGGKEGHVTKTYDVQVAPPFRQENIQGGRAWPQEISIYRKKMLSLAEKRISVVGVQRGRTRLQGVKKSWLKVVNAKH